MILLDTHVELFNLGVRTGDWEPMLKQFEAAAELEFRGIPVGRGPGEPLLDVCDGRIAKLTVTFDRGVAWS